MSKHLSTHPEFIKSFVETCFNHGFTEKQANDLLQTYAKSEFYLTDKNFKDGVDEGMKSASLLRNLAIPAALGLGGAALAPSGILPENWTGGLATGGALGGALGLLATRGRGLGGALSRMGRALSSGGVGRQSAKELARLASNPSLLKGMARGSLAGGAAVATNKALNEGVYIPGRYPMFEASTGVPSYIQNSGVGGAPGSGQKLDPFDLPPEIMADIRGGAQGAAGVSPGMGQITNQRQQIVDLNNQIQNLERNLPLASNPSDAARRQQLQTQIDNLKMQRNMMTTNIMQAEEQMNRDRYNIADSAARRQEAAAQGLQSSQTEFENLRRRQQFAQGGGFLGGLMDIYNRVSGAQGRMAELDPIYSGYMKQLQDAQNLQQFANQ